MLKTDARHKIQERQHTLQVKGRVKRKKPKKPFAQAAKEPKEKILGQTSWQLTHAENFRNLIRQDAAKSQLSVDNAVKKGTTFLQSVRAGGFSGSALCNEQSISEGV